MWNLSSPSRDWTHTPCIGTWNLYHWTAREVPSWAFWFVWFSFFPLPYFFQYLLPPLIRRHTLIELLENTKNHKGENNLSTLRQREYVYVFRDWLFKIFSSFLNFLTFYYKSGINVPYKILWHCWSGKVKSESSSPSLTQEVFFPGASVHLQFHSFLTPLVQWQGCHQSMFNDHI